jgi:adenylate cyclase
MFKKYYEYILVFIISLALSSRVYNFLKHIEATENRNQAIQFPLQTALENASHRWNDLFYHTQSKTLPSSDVMVLAIDEPSIIEIGRWPWSRNVINKITEQLLKYNVQTVSYDIIFSEKETNSDGDSNFIKTITKSPDKLIFGTFSDTKFKNLPYQDFCLNQAFLYTGGGNLAKVNPFFSVDDETNKYEVIEFNKLFVPLFRETEQITEKNFFKDSHVNNRKELSPYQLNTLKFTTDSAVYDYCRKWLTPEDDFKINENPKLKSLYFEVFKVFDQDSLTHTLNEFKMSALTNPIIQYTMWRQNISEIQSIARYTASFIADPDSDGIVRNYPLVLRTGNQLGTSYIPSLALQAYIAATGYQALFKIDLEKNVKKLDHVDIKDVSGEKEIELTSIPVDSEGNLLINYYGKQNTIPFVSAKDLLNDSETLQFYTRVPNNDDFSTYKIKVETVKKADFLKKKNVIFGATAVGVYDIRTTPIDIKYPGPEIHASILSNLLNREYLAYDRNEFPNSAFIFFIFIFFSLVVYIKTGLRTATIFYLIEMAVLIYLTHYFYNHGHLYHSSFTYLVLLSVGFLLTFMYKYFFQSRKSNEIKKAFSKYVSKDLVDEILKNEGAIELRGQKLLMSVYFSDIRGFTEFSEKMDPVELSELLNKYFTPMSAIITSRRGTIDKYIGDAVMAMFGAPINYTDHAYNACLAAIECVQALSKINQDFAIKNWPKINIGIGINTGYMNAGNIGSETIQNYTVIGDSVNLASRLESLNKDYGTQIIISEFTFNVVKDQFVCKELDKVKVKGKQELVTIYELLSLK